MTEAAPDPPGYTAIIMAGRRRAEDPIAAARGAVCKALAPALGKPMLLRVFEALGAAPRISRIVIVKNDGLGPIQSAPEFVEAARGKPVTAVEADPSSIGESLYAALAARPGETHFLFTAADHALLSPDMIDDFLERADKGNGLSIAFVEKTAIDAVYPGLKRTYFRFRDSAVSSANLFAMNGPEGLNAIRFWIRLESFRKRPLRVVFTFGVFNLIRFYFRIDTLDKAFARISRIVKCPTHPVIMSDPVAAIDVDTLADMKVVEAILARRES